MKRIKVRATFITEVLGTAPNDTDIYNNFLASKAPDAMSREEEIEAIGLSEVTEKGMTVFPRSNNGTPIFYDYQIKGNFKSAAQALNRCKGESFSKATCALKAHRKVIDTNIFVEPREIPINVKGEIGVCQRPLRAATAQGERIALASSETVPAGSTIEFTIVCLSDSHVPAVMEWLDYGKYVGLGAWRCANHGSFYYEILDEDGNVIAGNKVETGVA